MPNYDIESPNFVPISPNVIGPPPSASAYAPTLGCDLAALIEIRDTAFRAYMKALKAGKSYNAEGMMITRYDLDSLKKHYIDARDEVDNILRHGNASSMVVKRIIPFDR